MAVAQSIEELVAYQLAVELRDRILPLCRRGPLSRDFKYRDQLRDAARSAPRNLAEGFARFRPRQFATLARVALGSACEVIDVLQDGDRKHYFDETERLELVALAQRVRRTTTGLLRYLDGCGDKAPTGWDASTTKPGQKAPSPKKRPR